MSKRLIMVDIENVEKELKDLFERWCCYKGYKTEIVEVYEDEFYFNDKEFEPYKYYWLDCRIVGEKKFVSPKTGEVSEIESIAFEKVYEQYDFNTKKLYGFFEVIQTSGTYEIVKDWEFAEFMAKVSRGIELENDNVIEF